MPSSPDAGSILLVDDDPDLLEALTMALERFGHRVVTARNGREALAVLRHGTPPNVILLDLMMPVMNGWEFRMEQRKDPALAAVPVVILSGGGEVEKTAASLGVADALSKPLTIQALLATVRRFTPSVPRP